MAPRGQHGRGLPLNLGSSPSVSEAHLGFEHDGPISTPGDFMWASPESRTFNRRNRKPDTGILILVVNLGFNELYPNQYLPERPPCRLTTEPRGKALPLQGLKRRWNPYFILTTLMDQTKYYFLKSSILENYNFKKVKRKPKQCLNLYFS